MRILKNLTLLQLKEYLREPGTLFWTLGFPIIMAWILGIAFSQRDKIIFPVGLVTTHAPKQAEDWIARVERAVTEDPFLNNRIHFKFLEIAGDSAGLGIKRGFFPLYLEFLGNEDKIHYVFDLQNDQAQRLYLWLTHLTQTSPPDRSAEKIIPLVTQGTRYIDFLIPGLLAMGIMNSCLWGTGLALVELRMKKMMRRLFASPMSRTVFMLSHLITRLGLTFLEVMILYGFAYFYFKINIQGSLGSLALIILAGNAAFHGLSVLLASRTNKTQIAYGLLNALSFPMTILSGVFFSYHNFPDWAVSSIRWLPLTLLSDGIRSIFIEGAGLREVFLEMVALAMIGGITFILGLKIFKWY